MSIQEENLAAIAAAIREKEGSAGAIPAKDFARRILALPSGGGSAAFAVPLTVTVDPGAQVTAVNGEHTVTGTSGTEGTVVLILPAPGSWQITGELNGKSKTTSMEVSDGYALKIALNQNVPDGCTELEYVQTQATTRVNSGLRVPVNATRIVMDIVANEAGSKTTKTFFQGYYRNARGDKFYIQLEQDFNATFLNSLGLYWYAGKPSLNRVDGLYFAYEIKEKERILIDFDPQHGKISLNDSVITFTGGSTNAGNAPLSFGQSMEGNNTPAFLMSIYSIKVYTGDAMIGNFIPCQYANGKIGFYNSVTETFTSTTNLPLLAGPAV